MDDLKSFFIENAKKFDVELSSEQLDKFFLYKDLLLEWNEKMNLTAITDDKEVILKHFVDSLTVLKYVSEKKGIKLIDVGTGAGFPGVPLKIIRENLDVTLFDSLNKRLIFLNKVIEKLGLRGIKTVHGRSEDFALKVGFREEYDVVIARAVANLPVLLEYCLPFVKVGGIFIVMKGADFEKEIEISGKALNVLGGEIENVDSFLLDEEQKRAIIVVKKVAKTPEKYPRRAGLVSKQPIL